MVLAVLQQHCGIRSCTPSDVFASTVGGARLSEPASDLALAVARRPRPSLGAAPPAGVVAMGEIGLAGELRRVRDLPQRLAEAARLGFRLAVVPSDRTVRGPHGREPRTVDGMQVHRRPRRRLRAAAARARRPKAGSYPRAADG